jgi:hypothetical protein
LLTEAECGMMRGGSSAEALLLEYSGKTISSNVSDSADRRIIESDLILPPWTRGVGRVADWQHRWIISAW